MARNFELIINEAEPVINNDGVPVTRAFVRGVLASKSCRYAMASHPVDDLSTFPHCHCGIHTDSDNTFETIASWFGVPVNAVQKIRGRYDSTYLLYLIHYNKEGKTPIDPSEIESNFEINYPALIARIEAKQNSEARLNDIISGIADETIKQYNITEHVTAAEYSKYKTKIERAFDYMTQKRRGMNRTMQCIFITGDSGTGKTTYAKQIAQDRGLRAYISSGSNDVLDDYRGEPCIILDDLRPSCLSLSDLLKMLDNNTASSVKSRFRNKVLSCELIIITTTLDIDSFFYQVFESETETRIQLKRRCETLLKFKNDVIVSYQYDPAVRDYVYVATLPNIILAQRGFSVLSPEQQRAKLAEVLGMTGQAFEDLARAVDSSYHFEEVTEHDA